MLPAAAPAAAAAAAAVDPVYWRLTNLALETAVATAAVTSDETAGLPPLTEAEPAAAATLTADAPLAAAAASCCCLPEAATPLIDAPLA